MDNTTYPGSESNNNDIYNLQSNMSTELDCIDQCLDLSVEREILKGYKLRVEKQRYETSYRDKCGVPSRDCYYSPYVDYYSRKYPTPKPLRKNTRTKANTIYSRNCPTSSYGAYISAPFNCNIKARCPVKCPLRIAELAVPTKRQCIETWRNKCDILPDFMVERLRQQIVDEKPIVQIADAITCFKRRKSKPKKSTNRSKRINDTKLKNDKLIELCALFAKQLTQKLITPKNLKLNPELNQISKIVAYEIADIMKTQKRSNTVDNKLYTEISDKIAVWIATILEDTAYKILEEDLRELEEEEGPALDFLDEVIDNALNICMPNREDLGEYSKVTSKTSGEQYDKSNVLDSLENNEFDTSALSTSVTYDIGNRMIANEINDIVESSQENGLTITNNDSDVFGQTDLNTKEIRNEIDKIINSITINDHKERELIVNKEIIDENSVKLAKSNEENLQNIYYSDIKDEIDDVGLGLQDSVEKTKQDNDHIVSELEAIEDDALISERYSETRNDENRSNDISDPKSNPHKYSPGTLDKQDASQKFKQENEHVDPNLALTEDDTLISQRYFDTMTDINQSNDISDPKSNSDKYSVSISDLHDTLNNSKQENQQTIPNPNLVPIEVDTLVLPNNSDTEMDINQSNDLSGSKSNLNNVSDVLEIFAKESTDEKKTVKFSNTDLGGNQTIENLSEKHKSQLQSDEYLKSKNSNTKHQLTFAPPNEKLLSEIDEPWPADLSSSMMKATASVNRSITSLGKLLETDETLSISLEENIKTKSDDIFHIELELVNQDVLSKIDTDTELSNDLEDHSKTKLIINNEFSENKSKIYKQNQGSINTGGDKTPNVMRKNQNSLKTSNASVNIFKNNLATPVSDWRNKILKNIKSQDSTSGVINNVIHEKSEPKFDYKVHLNTAPLWVKQDHGKGEPNQNSSRYKSLGQLEKSDLLIWSKNLERMFANMELWNRWLETTCKEAMYLKHKRDVNKWNTDSKRKNFRDWVKLKKNIDQDAILWAKLTKRLYIIHLQPTCVRNAFLLKVKEEIVKYVSMSS